jgi:hypothetical protein
MFAGSGDTHNVSAMAENRRTRTVPGNFLKNCLLLLCLFAPSAWMIATIPPLWRDADAYVQVTQNPLVATFWGHAPAYCYIAKVPLFAGEQFERLRGLAPADRGTEPSQPAVTDSGIWLLVILQHLGLGVAGFYFIKAISDLFWVRLVVALTWASNALFYTFAHCVGSETLGMILIVVLVVTALPLIQSCGEPGWRDWYLFAVVQVLCFLSRELNLGLIALLPAAFLFSWAQNRFAALRATLESSRLRLRQFARQDLRHAVIALAVGIACVAVGHSMTQGFARKTRFHPHSRIGFTFLWRLRFLGDLSPESRSALLRKVSARAPSNTVRDLIALLEQMHLERADRLDPPAFMQRAIKPFGGTLHWEELDRALNRMAFAFLWPPSPELLDAARRDFVAALKLPSTVISEHLFAATSYYFQHKDEMPACANLVTYRGDANADKVGQLPFQHRYFHLWQGFNYLHALAIWFIALLVFVITARRKRMNPRGSAVSRAARDDTAITAFGIALMAVGLLLFAASCLLHDYEPRFGLSMWQLLLLSLFLFVGRTVDLLAHQEPRPPL